MCGMLRAGGMCLLQVGCVGCRWGVVYSDGVCWVQMGRAEYMWDVLGADQLPSSRSLRLSSSSAIVVGKDAASVRTGSGYVKPDRPRASRNSLYCRSHSGCAAAVVRFMPT